MSTSTTQDAPTGAIDRSTDPAVTNDAFVKDLGLEAVNPSLQNFPSVGLHTQLEQLQMIDQETPVSLRTQRLRQTACYLCLYISGYNCGVTGTLLPSIEKIYHLSYSSVALLFVAFCVGYFLSAFGSGKVIERWGFGMTFIGAGMSMMIGIIINCSQLVSFALMCVAFAVVGMGFATQLGLANAYFATLPHPMLRMGLLHGLYGFGAFTSPLVASTFISHHIKINLFYLTSLGLIVPSIIISYFAFVHGSARYDRLPREPVVIVTQDAEVATATLKEVVSRYDVWILALFLLFYIGAEESIGGWIVSYMEVVRHGTAGGAAWVASGFYLGIAVGRVCLPLFNLLIGERRVVLLYIILAGGLQAISWAVKSFGATAVATALVGFVISTFYTAAIHMASKLLPRRMHTSAMTMISSIGQSGSAIFPFIIGVISNNKGIWTVQPSIVALLAGQFICWSLVPRVGRRAE
ncbi:MFS general substrate transporter [Sanghuangporus baumii]|uniref:MFS general substrate transporter n=1 Tax=Sanghuangporus baumii TaxID=108892 RepID=A0A9Q5HRK3_SANBA|nr:MFS general substrate transporter [Sanghuangporus baumii]